MSLCSGIFDNRDFVFSLLSFLRLKDKTLPLFLIRSPKQLIPLAHENFLLSSKNFADLIIELEKI